MVSLDTLSSRHEKDVGAHPPLAGRASDVAPGEPSAPLILREILVDVACADLVRASLRDPSITVVTIDLAAILASGDSVSLPNATAVALGPVLRGGQPAVDAIEQLRGKRPHLGIYVVARSTAEIAHLLPELAAAGVDEVFCLDTNADAGALEETLSHRLAAPAPETEIRLLWKWFSKSPERALVMHCVRNGYRLDAWTIRSRVFSACRKTLQNRLTFVKLLSPGVLSRCGRVLHAQELERRGVAPTEVVAELLGFPSRIALHRSRRRLRKALMSRGRQALVFVSLLK